MPSSAAGMRMINICRNLCNKLPGIAANSSPHVLGGGNLPAAAAASQVTHAAAISSSSSSGFCWRQHQQQDGQPHKGQQQQQQQQQQAGHTPEQQHLQQHWRGEATGSPPMQCAAAAAASGWAAHLSPQHDMHQQQALPLPSPHQQQPQRGSGLLAAPGQQQWHQLQRLPQWQQWQQQRGLLGAPKRKNYQDHNQKRPKKNKIKTPSIAKRRVVVGEDGVMWRMQAGRRHKRYKKSRERLQSLKGMVPLHYADAAKLRKLGFNRKWWYSLKA